MGKDFEQAHHARPARYLVLRASGDTRDWIVFEIGVAVGHDRPVFCWNQRNLSKGQLPRLLEQVTTYREFDISSKGVIKLAKETRAAAKEL